MTIHEAMSIRYAAPEWILTFEVRNKTGFTRGKVRYADAVAVNTFPSRGHELHGFEFKASRSDWLSELKDGQKSEAIFAYCDRWWIVAPAGVVNESEVPKTWGYLVAHESGLRAIKQAPELQAKARDWPFVVSLLRRVSERAPVQGLDASRELSIRADERKCVEAYMERRAKQAKEHGDELGRNVAEFERKSGIRIRDNWTWRNMDGALSLLSRPNDLAKTLRLMIHERQRDAETLTKALDSMNLLSPGPAGDTV